MNKLDTLNRQENLTCDSHANINKYDIECQIEQIIEQQTASAAFRAKCRYSKDGGKNTKLFLSLEKSRFKKKTMRSLMDNGQLINKNRDIVNAQQKFYAELYKSNPQIRFTFVNNSGNKLDMDSRVDLDREITVDDFTQAVRTLKHNKSPGPDGIMAEFMQFFWGKIKDMYYKAIICAKQKGHLHLSTCRGIIQLIPKKGRDPLLLKNWRPLTMLSIDYKILAKALADRLKVILPDLISEEQNSFMQGRQISSTIRIAMDIARYNKNINGYLLSLDFEKCFDRLEYERVAEILQGRQ